MILCLWAKCPSMANETSVASMVAGSGTTRPSRLFGTSSQRVCCWAALSE